MATELAGIVMVACIFIALWDLIPPHEPWTCRVHKGIRTRLDESQCDAIRPVKPLTAGQLDNLRKADAEGRVPVNRYIVRGLLAALAEAAAGPKLASSTTPQARDEGLRGAVERVMGLRHAAILAPGKPCLCAFHEDVRAALADTGAEE